MGGFQKQIKNILPLFLLLLPAAISDACGPDVSSYHGYSFVNQHILDKNHVESHAPLVSAFDQIYNNYFEKNDSANINENLAEWQDRYCGLVRLADLEYIVYKSSITDLELLVTNTNSKSMPVPHRLRGNSFAEYVWENKCTENAEYLIFAKKCEPHVIAGDDWQPPKRDTMAMKRLINRGQKEFNSSKSHYMKLRYAYQVVRLAHYAGQYKQALKLYDRLIPKIDKHDSRYAESIIPWWIEGHRAGAMMALGDGRRLPIYMPKYSVFAGGGGSRPSLVFPLKRMRNGVACLKLCESDEERAMLYSIRASNPKNNAVEEMQAIYRLDPKSPQLELLLVQEIRKVERHLLGLKFNSRRRQNKRRYGVPQKGIEVYAIDLQEFARLCRSEKRVERPDLWLIAEGYLEFLASDFYAAEKTFQEASRQVEDELLKEQLDVFLLAMEIARFKKPDAKVEEVAYEIMKENELYIRYPDFRDYLRDKMRWLYEDAGQESKALLCHSSLNDLKPNPLPDMVDELLAVMRKPGRTQFERLLTERFSVSDLLDMKAVFLMGEGQVEAAMQIYNRIPATEWAKYGRVQPFY